MVMSIVGIYTFFVLLTMYISVMQIGYVNQAKRGKAVLLSESEFIKAGNYTIAKEKMSIASTFVEYIVFLFWIGFGIKFLESSFSFESEALLSVSVVMGFLVINSLVSLPFGYYEKFVLDAQFGFNKSTMKQWVKDTLKSFLLMLFFGSLIVLGITYIINNLETWWFFSFIFVFIVVILMFMIQPIIMGLLFDKLIPLPDKELEDKIKELMDRTGFVSSGVFMSDASKRDARLNAYFGGLGKTKRVVLFDTLIEKLTTKELLAVLGHELGHFAHGDIYKNIAMVGAMLFGMFALFGNLPSSLYTELGIKEAPYAMMILLLLFMPVLGFLMMPIMGVVSRRNEYAADKMGSELGGASGAVELANALTKLVNENKSFPLSHPLYIFFHYTHPPVLERLKELGVALDGADKSALGAACQADI